MYLLSKYRRYKIIIRSITSETTFNVLVRDNLGLEHWEYKEWCKIN